MLGSGDASFMRVFEEEDAGLSEFGGRRRARTATRASVTAIDNPLFNMGSMAADSDAVDAILVAPDRPVLDEEEVQELMSHFVSDQNMDIVYAVLKGEDVEVTGTDTTVDEMIVAATVKVTYGGEASVTMTTSFFFSPVFSLL